MKLVLTKEERDKVLYDILCNGGIGYLASSDVELTYNDKHYKGVRKEGDCYEDVLLKLINSGNKLVFIDHDGGDFSKTLTRETLKQALTNVEDPHFCKLVLESLNGDSDAETGYNLIQFILYGKIIFG
jgi:hypothetical protein